MLSTRISFGFVLALALGVLLTSGLSGRADTHRAVPTAQCPPEAPTPAAVKDAFEDADAFIKSVTSPLERSEKNAQEFYVAISEASYLAADHTGCPWSLLDSDGDGVSEQCPFGDDANDGRSSDRPFATFKHAMSEMKAHREAEGKNTHYTLYIRGGVNGSTFHYQEPIYIGTYKTRHEVYEAPVFYDRTGDPVKIDTSTGELISKSCDPDAYAGISESNTIVADITVRPYNDETVTLDGGCEFAGLTAGDEGWDNNETEMEKDCGDAWPDAETPGTLDHLIYTKASFGMVTVRYAFNVNVEGLRVRNSPGHGIRVLGGRGTSNVVITDNEVDNSYGVGIRADYGSNYVIRNNTSTRSAAGSILGGVHIGYVDNVVVAANTISETYNDESIGVGNDVHNTAILDNHIYSNAGTGIYLNAAAVGMHQRVRTEANIIHDNVYSNCIRLASENDAPHEMELVTNNICYNNLHGIWVAGYCSFDACDEIPGVPMKDIYILNNTVWGNGVDEDGYSRGGLYNPYHLGSAVGYGFRMNNADSERVYVMNNIFSENAVQQLLLQSEVRYDGNDDGTVNKQDPIDTEKLTLKNNITFCSDDAEVDEAGNLRCLWDNWWEYPGQLSLQLDPKLADPENGDFHLSGDSPARDTGLWDTHVPRVDYEDDKRIKPAVDIGADEARRE